MNLLASEFLAAVLAPLLQLIAGALGLLLIRLTAVARQRWGIEIEARHREALHSALMSGIQAALSRGLTGNVAISAALDYAGKSVPDAIAALGPATEVLQSIAESKLRDALPWVGVDHGTSVAVSAPVK